MFCLTVCFVVSMAGALTAEMIGAGWLAVSCLAMASWFALMLTSAALSRTHRIAGKPSDTPSDTPSKEPWPVREK